MKLISKFLILFICFSTLTSGNNIDSLLILLEEQKGSTDLDLLYQTHITLGQEYGTGGNENYEASLSHYSIALEIAKNQNDVVKIAESLFGIGLSHQRTNNFQEALESYSAILELSGHSDKELKKANTYTQISSIHQAFGNYESAYEYQMKALHLHDLTNDSLGIANSHYNIGSIFYYQNQYEQALNHYYLAYVICDALKNERFIYSCLAAIGSVNEKLENQKESLDYNTRSLKLAEKLNYKTGIAYALGNIAMNYMVQGNFEKAEQYLRKSISLKLSLGDKWGAIGSEIDLSKLYIRWKKPSKALPILEQTLKMAKEVNSKTRKLDIYKNMSIVYEQLNDTLAAYSFTKRYLALKDSVLSEKTVEEMGQSKRRYEIQKHEHEISILKKENELLGKNKKIQKLQIYIFAVTGLLLLSFLWWYRIKLRYQNKMNGLLEEKNEILYLKNEEINVKNKQLEYSNESLQQFAYVASHDLKEPLRMISSYSSLLDRRYRQLIDESGKEFLHFIIDGVSRMDTLLEDLLKFSRAGSQSAPTKLVSVEDVMFIVESNLRYRFDNINGKLIIHNENLPSIKAHQTQMIQLLQNLVSNAVKFKGERAPVVTVDCKKVDNKYTFSVKDNGIGISKENLEKVFDMFRRLNTKVAYEGTGIGLATCKRIVNSWGGDIWVESVEGEGSTFFFTFPYSVDKPVLAEDSFLEESLLVERS